MNTQLIDCAGKFPGRASAVARDPLQIPVELNFAPEHPLARIIDVLQSVALWALAFAVAVSGALLVGNMPELNAAVPIVVISEPAPSASKAREWYLPEVLFNESAATAQPIDTF